MIKPNNEFRKKQTVQKWLEMGKPVLSLEVLRQLRQETALGVMDTKRAIIESDEFKEMVRNQPKIDMSQCPVEKPVKIFDPDGKLLVETNDIVTYTWVRTQIKEKKLYGYYIEFEGMKIHIDARGTEAYFPKGMMDLYTDLMFELI
jgi:hypothetical protein